MSSSTWRVLMKLIAIVALPHAAPWIIEGDHTANGLNGKRAIKPYIALMPAHQRHGIRSSLLRQIQVAAATRGVPVRLNVLKVNPACALYERLGFAVVGEMTCDGIWSLRLELGWVHCALQRTHQAADAKGRGEVDQSSMRYDPQAWVFSRVRGQPEPSPCMQHLLKPTIHTRSDNT